MRRTKEFDDINHNNFMELCYDIGIDPRDLYQTMVSDSDEETSHVEL